MDLGDGRGAEGSRLEVREGLVNCDPQLGFDHALDFGEGQGGETVAKGRQGSGGLRGDEVGASGRELSGLGVGPPQVPEQLDPALRDPGVGRTSARGPGVGRDQAARQLRPGEDDQADRRAAQDARQGLDAARPQGAPKSPAGPRHLVG